VSRLNLALVLLALTATLVGAGCGDGGSPGGGYGGGDSTAAGETTGGEATGTPTGAIVSVGSVAGLGRVLVDSEGFTLYDFHKDRGATSSCYGGCAQVWPPLTTEGEAQASNGASNSKLGTTKRKDGTTQVTYAGHPLYTYAEDRKPGDSKGNDIDSFGAEWYALEPSGAEPED
jgi:predicted lipoprotein with Yx(FWY)xxD motif